MNWDAIGAVGEVVGAGAVVLTLVLLMLQIRKNTEAMQASLERDSTSRINQTGLQLLNPDVVAVISKAWTKPTDLSSQDMAALENWMMTILNSFEQDYRDYQRGFIDKARWNARKTVMKRAFVPEVLRIWWTTTGFHFYPDPGYSAIVRRAVEEAEGEGVSDYWAAFWQEYNRRRINPDA